MTVVGIMALVALVVTPAAGAATLAFAPSYSAVDVGGHVQVDVLVLGLAPVLSVGAFDLSVSFAASVLSFVDVDFFPYLGNPDAGEALTAYVLSPGEINFAEVSLLPPGVLDLIQPEPLQLATLTFTAIATGVSPLFFTGEVIVDDAFGEVLPVAIDGALVVVPNPAPLGSLLAGLAAMLVIRRLRSRHVTGGAPRPNMRTPVA